MHDIQIQHKLRDFLKMGKFNLLPYKLNCIFVLHSTFNESKCNQYRSPKGEINI